MATRPEHVGILALDVYFPSTYVSQSDLEVENGVSAGKYTVGLGQKAMAFVGDTEDVNSVCLTVVANLLDKYGIRKEDVGRLEVGTETLVDKAKSTKTVLMDLFEGNTDIEGVTTVNACYGGTAALLNSVAWVESSGWDGRYAIVVAADIAVYAEGPARPAGGCGAAAILIGPDAPLPLSMKFRATHAANVYDFFKPQMESEYPLVDGALSQACYFRSLDDCYNRLIAKKEAAVGHFSANDVDWFVFHSPYNKLVQKGFARLLFNDARSLVRAGKPLPSHLESLLPWMETPLEETYTDRGLHDALRKISVADYEKKVEPNCELSRQIGNTYTASVFAGLACLVDVAKESLEGKRIFVYSYGSGSVATMYEIVGRAPSTEASSRFSLGALAEKISLAGRLAEREKLNPVELAAAMDCRAVAHAAAPYTPVYPIDRLFPGTYYLEGVNADFSRRYARVPLDAVRYKGDENGQRHYAPALSPSQVEMDTAQTDGTSSSDGGESMKIGRASVVLVTGVAAGLPGQSHVFEEDNLEKLVKGENSIFALCDRTKASMVEKNVVQVRKRKDGGDPDKVPIKELHETIQLAARLGTLDMSKYGVSPSIAATMDKAVQVAVAAGLEAMKDAGLVKGGPTAADWKLPEHLRDGTGVVYASSFPGMDAAIAEVMRFLRSRCITRAKKSQLLLALKKSLAESSANGHLSLRDTQALQSLEDAMITKSTMNLSELAEEAEARPEQQMTSDYEFDRKFLFRVLVLGNAQLAQIVGARGPNMQTNAACAGSTQAVAMAQDMIQVGRCDRVVVIAGDDASGEALLPWVGNGFCALGAASISASAEEAALPFDRRRNGMILGAGAIGMVLETEESSFTRTNSSFPLARGPLMKAHLLETQISNSAFHGASMDKNHIATELERFLQTIQKNWDLDRETLAKNGVYFSHETCTHATPTASCAFNEVFALRECFGEALALLPIINTKGFTGHPMGVSFEDVCAVEVLTSGVMPPTANYKEVDENLGALNLSEGGTTQAKFAIRFAAGFGSQVAFALYAALGAV